MTNQNIVAKLFTSWFSRLVGVALILQAIKYILTGSTLVPTSYIPGLGSLSLLLFMLILCRTKYLEQKSEIDNLNKLLEKIKNEEQQGDKNLDNQFLNTAISSPNKNKSLTIKEEITENIFAQENGLTGNRDFFNSLIDATQAVAAILYTEAQPSGVFTVKKTFGLPDDYTPASFVAGEGLNGQVLLEGVPRAINDLPGDYLQVVSGLGNAKPAFLYILPVMNGEKCEALIELATFKKTGLEIIWQDISAQIIEKRVLHDN